MCGIFGIFGARKAAELTAIGLHGIQHRAVEYAGIVSSEGHGMHRHAGPGITRDVFDHAAVEKLHGLHALGHIRYSTVEDKPDRDPAQPILGMFNGVPFAVAHNGTLTNWRDVATRRDLRFVTSIDTECIVRLIEWHGRNGIADFHAALAVALSEVRGSFALGILLPEELIAVRDPAGNRPLSIGRINGGYCITSETCALSNVEAEFVSDVAPGTMVRITQAGLELRPYAKPCEHKCRFEAIYFGHPASCIFGEPVQRFRIDLGKALEEACPCPGGDIVSPIPDSATFIAYGYGSSGRSGVFFPVITRSHFVGRTFIVATQADRDEKVSSKFAFSAEEIAGKSIVLVDDSIVRGTTLPKIVRALRRCGAKAIHVRIASPPMRHSCSYGIDTPDETKLIANRVAIDGMAEWSGADSVVYLPMDSLRARSPHPDSFCYACMNGTYW